MIPALVSRRAAGLAFAVTCWVLAAEPLLVGQAYRTFRDAAGRFEIEYPAKDWNLLPAGGSAVGILFRSDRTATVVIDLVRLTEPLTPSEVAANARLETETLKEQQPQAKDFKSETLDTKAGHASVIRFARMGVTGSERVIRCLVAVGHELYRLDAVVPDGSQAKHEATLMHMIQSFKVPAAAGSAKN